MLQFSCRFAYYHVIKLHTENNACMLGRLGCRVLFVILGDAIRRIWYEI